MKIIFMGTPDFAVGTLEALITGGYEIALVVTQPDKPQGRKMELTPPPVKVCALQHGREIYQPTRVSIRTDPAKRLTGIAEVRMHQCACITASELSLFSTNPVVDLKRRRGNRCDDHADGHRY